MTVNQQECVASLADIIEADGTQVETEPLSVATETVFPNGEECPGEAQQLALVLGASGLRPQ